MMSIDQVRKQILGHLQDMGDQEMQKREWTTNVKDTWYFPDEIFARWFDDTFNGNHEQLIKEGLITEDEWKIIEPLDTKLDSFVDEYEKNSSILPSNLLNVPEWFEISLLAKKTVEKLLKLGWNME